MEANATENTNLLSSEKLRIFTFFFQPKTDVAPAAPITHPLLGAVPQEQGPPSMVS